MSGESNFGPALLATQGLSASYGHIAALKSITITICSGEVVVVLGPNGAGKSTLLRTLMGLVARTAGDIVFCGQSVVAWPTYRRASAGMVLVPEGRGILGPLTVMDNLLLGTYGRRGGVSHGGEATQLESVFRLFPRLKERRNQRSGSLSGGEQQMLAIGRAMMAKPQLLLLDEPSLGLAPRVIEEIFEALSLLKVQGLTIFLVEQKAPPAMRIADRAYVLRTGEMVADVRGRDMARTEELAKLYLGAHA